jgi:hypothetical protein
MQYLFDGEFYTVIKITGPTHNILKVKFSNINNTVKVINLDNNISNISKSEVERQVVLGLSEINRELGSNYKINTLQFVSSDSKSDTIYKDLVKSIIQRLHFGGKFNNAN